MVDEIVRRIRNPLNALLLNIDNLEGEIAEVNIETSRAAQKDAKYYRGVGFCSAKFSGFQNCQSLESRLSTSTRSSGMWKLLPNPSHRKRN